MAVELFPISTRAVMQTLDPYTMPSQLRTQTLFATLDLLYEGKYIIPTSATRVGHAPITILLKDVKEDD